MMKIGLNTGGSGTAKMNAGLRALNGSDVLVGIPESGDRRAELRRALAALKPGGRRHSRVAHALKSEISNAALLFIHTNGSPKQGIDARPVIEPAISQPDTAGQIAKQLAGAAVAALDGDAAELERRLNRAGIIGESASKKWFTDSRNNWKPNAQSTIDQKGSDRPLIDTGALRRAITHVVELSPVTRTMNGANMKPKSSKVADAEEAAEEASNAAGDAAEGLAGAAEAVAEVGGELAESAEIVVAL